MAGFGDHCSGRVEGEGSFHANIQAVAWPSCNSVSFPVSRDSQGMCTG